MEANIYTCTVCEALNKVANPEKIGRWKCGRCGSVLFYKKRKYHDSTIQKVRIELVSIYEEVSELDRVSILTRGTHHLERKWERTASIVQNWNQHLAYDPDESYVDEVRESYKADLREIDVQIKKIIALMDEKNWLKRIIRKNERIRRVLTKINQLFISISKVLAFFGIGFGLSNLLESFGYKYLEKSTTA